MSYPIVQQRPLDPSQKRGWLGLRGRARESGELPKPAAHQVLVYRVNGHYVVDNAERALNSEDVVEASHVSVVDMTRNAEVMVQLGIPSKDADQFTMQVTFVCTVSNPAVVVREGMTDAQAMLRAYLKSHNRIFELGLAHKLDDVNEVRRNVNAQVKAFATVKPPVMPGIDIEVRSVEVLTPAGLAEFERKRTQQQRQHRLVAEQQGFDQARELDQDEHTQLRSTKQQRHDLSREAERKDFDRYQRREDRLELNELSEAIRNDPQRVLLLAWEQGLLGPVEMAERMSAEARRVEDNAREDRAAELEHKRAMERAQLEQSTEDRRWRRDIEQQQLLWRREDESFRREDVRQQRQIKLEVIRELGKHGYLDMTNLDPNRLVDELTTKDDAPQVGPADETPALPSAADVDLEDDEDDEDTGVREEDAG
ncbi:hypothetical protein KIPE111705_16855 [Kibdelosporangium persicum]|uniref:Band 7 domain-containing protein n=1 Tax=Kibdelosporangium persicum TaxID=2698649 RepID=A0ABX2EZE8_9PSEU|nr:hypothetical protein [Kibdelosporangium persicum]NRN64048.1 hypothetical protein [Kibdelosporangium persicum]